MHALLCVEIGHSLASQATLIYSFGLLIYSYSVD